MNATDVIAYTFNGELLCAEHGADLDTPENADELGVVFADGSSEWNAVEYCSNGADAHSFCMICGTFMESFKGAHDGDFNGHFGRCWNCATESVYVDGVGYTFTNGWTDALETHDMQVYGAPTGAGADLGGYTTVTAVLDEHTGPMHQLQAFAVYLQHSPSAGCVLVLANSWTDAYGAGADELMNTVGCYTTDEENDVRADVFCNGLPTDQIWFTSK